MSLIAQSVFEFADFDSPANWYLDDLPPMMYMKKVPNSHGFVNARDIEDLWRVSIVAQ